MQNAQNYLDAFERGEEFYPPAKGLINNGKADPDAITLLGQMLPNADSEVAEQIIELLVDVGTQTDPLRQQGTEMLHDHRIIALLANTASQLEASLSREVAADALRKLVKPAELAPYGEQFADALAADPEEALLLLIAKTKPPKAKAIIEQLIQSPQWHDNEAAAIAYAAMGATTMEAVFLTAMTDAEQAADGEKLAYALGSLSLIGTLRSVQAVAQRLRTPLITSVPGAFEKSVRLNVLEALLYHYPDQPVLYPNNIITQADYIAAEQFCTKTLGTDYKQSRPPFLTYSGAPIPLDE